MAEETMQGIQGEQGVAGPVGPTGPTGMQGVQGIMGPAGIAGPAGVDGVDGIDGIDGASGIDGLDGVNGIDGADGAPGIHGTHGDVGPTGPSGITDIVGAIMAIPYLVPNASYAAGDVIRYCGAIYRCTNDITIGMSHGIVTGDRYETLAAKFRISKEDFFKANPGVDMRWLMGSDIMFQKKEFCPEFDFGNWELVIGPRRHF